MVEQSLGPHENVRVAAVQHIRSPAGCYLADPIPVAGVADEFLVESFDLRKRRGSIHLLASVGNSWMLRDQMLGFNGHLSYPFTFTRRGELFLICESIDSGHVAAWALADNGSWRQIPPLSTKPLADPTVIEVEGRFVILAAQSSGPRTLVAHHTTDLLAGWQELKIDLDRPALNRPGGPPIEFEGGTYVPLQDSSRGYGSGIVWCHVTLEPDRVILKPAGRLDPPQGFVGLHTVAPSEDGWLVDLRRYRLRLSR